MNVFLFLSLLFPEPQVFPKRILSIDLGIPISRLLATMSQDRDIFILDPYLGTISRFNSDGILVSTFGKLGQGPGEMESPRILIFLEKLYVIGPRYANVFEKDGAFVEKVKFPVSGLVLKVGNGWINMDPGLIPPEETGRLVWYDHRFSQSATLAKWEQKPEGFQHRKLAQDNPLFALGPKGLFGYFKPPERFEIQVIDFEKKAVIHTIVKDIPPVPLKGKVAENYLAFVNKGLQDNNLPAKSKEDLPENFPLIRTLWVGVDGNIVASCIDPKDVTNNRYWYFDQQGNEIEPTLLRQSAIRVLGIFDNLAFVIAYSSESEASEIYLCPLAEVNDFVQKNPMNAFSVRSSR